MLNPARGVVFLTIAAILSSSAAIPVRAANTTLTIPTEFPIVGYGLTNAFGNLTFDEPVAIAFPPGETNRLFVAERTGRIMVITNLASPTRTEFIDLRLGELQPAYIEAGLLGLAFHPGYRTNGHFFVFRTIVGAVNGLTGFYDEVARFQADPQNPNRALPNSKLRILAQYDTSHLHNAGDLQFGPEGYLYIATGFEGPPSSNRPNTKQSIDEHLLGAILRIDVDKRPGNLLPTPDSSIAANYLIPADNPFIGVTNFNDVTVDPARVRTELYAVGLRNPWRITFDAETHEMYCADVGSGLVEEVNLVAPGANFGWPYYEGVFGGPEYAFTPARFVQTEPLYGYAHGSGMEEGNCIVGGPVYRGNRIPQLNGAYIFGDSINGRIRALRRNDTNGVTVEYLTTFPNLKTFGLTTFGTDPRNQDILAVNLDGHIMRLVYVPPEEVQYARTLADTGVFANLETLEPNPGFLPYEVNVPFWSDHAAKSRWFSVPDRARIGFSMSNNWTFPTGTVWVKHFELERTNGVAASRQRLETRLLVKNASGIYGLTYRWGNSRTNAELVPQEGLEETFLIRDGTSVRTQKWVYPGRADCLRCHTDSAGYALGFNTAQLNRPGSSGMQNQIEWLSAAGYLDAQVSSARNYPLLADVTDLAWPTEYRLRSYLSANCSQCHYPGGPPTTHWDARFTTRMAEANIVDARSALIGDPFRIIAPHNPSNSVLLGRLTGPGRMPPLATTVLDTRAIALVNEYIRTLPRPPWQHQDIGPTGREGSASVSNGVHRISGAGTNIAGTADQFHFLFQPLKVNGHLIARLVEAAPSSKAGIMFRQSLSNTDRYAMLTIQSNRSGWQFRSEDRGEAVHSEHAPARWLRLLREDSSVSGSISDDGAHWAELGSVAGFEGDLLAGLAASSLDNATLTTAAFDDVRLLSVSLADAFPTNLVASDAIEVEALVTAGGTAVQRVEFYDGAQLLGHALTPPYRFRWTNLIAGVSSIRARAIDGAGNSVFSSARHLTIRLPETRSGFSREDNLARGNWRGRYGSLGRVLAANSTNMPANITFESPGAPLKAFRGFSAQPRALRRETGARRVAAVWTSSTNFSFNVSLRDGELRSVSLYFVDFNTRNRRVETIEVIDPESGEVLQSRTVSRFRGGVYVTFLVRGAVRFQISHVSGPDAVLSGIFIDPATLEPARAEIVSDSGPLEFVLPTNVVLSATVTGDNPPAVLEMFANGQKIGEAPAPAYSVIWSNALSGVYSVVARGTDPLGTMIESPSVMVTVRLPPGAAEEVAIDKVTRGGWPQAYGTEGYAIAAHATNFPAFADVSFAKPAEWVWSAHSGDPRALLREEQTGRIMSAWLGDRFTIDVAIRDGRHHVVTLYFLDPESARRQRVEVIDATTEQLLEQREIERFDGEYISWTIQGHVRFRITAVLGNAVVSGIFLDADTNDRPAISFAVFGASEASRVPLAIARSADAIELSWPAAASAAVLQSKSVSNASSDWSDLSNPRTISRDKVSVRDRVQAEGKFYRLLGVLPPLDAARLVAPVSLTLAADASDGDGIRKVEFYADGKKLGETTTRPYQFTWPALAGNYPLYAKAIDNRGGATLSEAVTLDVKLTNAWARFRGIDDMTSGNWIEHYGSEGFVIINDAIELPIYGELTPKGHHDWYWERNTFDTRALQRRDSPWRIAAGWYVNYGSFTIDVALNDGRKHAFALYFLDWAKVGFNCRVVVRDAETGRLLDSRVANDYGEGRYYIWELQGRTRFLLSEPAGQAAVNGVFFDPLASP